ncbi:flippase [Streptococcus marimammalium]|uniref:flippase n=1 Tax=Streptococcus marimammalium TaxID=269666 RepID=UPI00036BE4C8|nr:flippase [Streptococcus marimammalium]
MNKYKSVRFNFLMNFILTISNFIFPLLTFPYASRVLMASGVGTVSFAMSIISYFSMIGMLGIPTYGIRASAKVRDDKEKLEKIVQEIVIINMSVMFFAIVALAITVLSVERLRDEKLLYLIMSSTLLFNVLGVDWLYKALEKYTYITIRSVIFKLLSLILLFLFIKNPEDYILYGAITVFAGVGSNLMNFINLRKLIKLKPMKNLAFKHHIKPIFTFFLLTVSTTIYLNVNTTLLGFMRNDEAVGYYSAAVKVKQILVSIVTSLGVVLLPRLSFFYEKGELEKFNKLTQKALNFILLISLPLMSFFIIVAKEIIIFLAGPSFFPSVFVMQIIMPTILLIGLSNLMGIQILVPSNRENLVVISTIFGAIVDIIVNVFTIPLWGVAGAGIASTLAELTVVCVQLFFLKSFIFPIFKRIKINKIIISNLIALIITFFLKNFLTVDNFFILVISSIIFFSVYVLCLLIFKEEFSFDLSKSLLSKLR